MRDESTGSAGSSLMQLHSGEHILSGIVHRRFGYDNVGFHMGADMVTIDFSGMLTEEDLKAVEREANEVVWENREIEITYPLRAGARADSVPEQKGAHREMCGL